MYFKNGVCNISSISGLKNMRSFFLHSNMYSVGTGMSWFGACNCESDAEIWPFVRGIHHRWSVDSPHKGPVTRESISMWWRNMLGRIPQAWWIRRLGNHQIERLVGPTLGQRWADRRDAGPALAQLTLLFGSRCRSPSFVSIDGLPVCVLSYIFAWHRGSSGQRPPVACTGD